MVIKLFKKDYINESLEELLIERQKLMKDIIKLENEEFLYNKEEVLMNPSPDTIWRVKNEDFNMLTELIENAFEIKRINEWMTDEQKELMRKILPNYEHMEISDIEKELELQLKNNIKIKELIDIVVTR